MGNPIYHSIYGMPKGLLPIAGKPGLSWWYEQLNAEQKEQVYIVAGAQHYKHYERWAIELDHKIPVNRLFCTGIADQRLPV